jgi:hypothetical protein
MTRSQPPYHPPTSHNQNAPRRTARPGARMLVDDLPAEVEWHTRPQHLAPAPLDLEFQPCEPDRAAGASSRWRPLERRNG